MSHMRPSRAPKGLALALSTTLAIGAFAALAGCAATPPKPAEAASAPAAEPAPETTAAPALPSSEAPPGELACRATTPEHGTSELYLSWEGGEAKGVLRRVAPSGERHVQKVHAERLDGMIIADDPHEKDLTKHAAMVRPIKGKAHIRLGEGEARWTACE